MARMTPEQLEINDLVNTWMLENGIHLDKGGRQHRALCEAIEGYLKKNDNRVGEELRRAVDAAYERGYNVANGLKG